MTNEEHALFKIKQLSRNKGRIAVIRNPYYTNIPEGTRVQIHSYDNEKNLYLVTKLEDYNKYYCTTDEVNFVDKEFSDYKIIKTGIRIERKDKYKDNFVIELINNKRDIYLSSALVSLLGLKEGSYVGFAFDPEYKINYIFNSDSANGYLFNEKNQRITSASDWRDLFNNWECTTLKLTGIPTVNNEDNPGFVFYQITEIFYDKGDKEMERTGVSYAEGLAANNVDYYDLSKMRAKEKINIYENSFKNEFENSGNKKQILK